MFWVFREKLWGEGKDLNISVDSSLRVSFIRAQVAEAPSLEKDQVKRKKDANSDMGSLFFSIVSVIVVLWILLQKDEWFIAVYYALMIITMPHRYISYKQNKKHYYMMDFCYLVNVSVILQTFGYSSDNDYCKSQAYKVCLFTNFSLSNGILLVAIVLWKNSLVFNNIDKLVSLEIHIMPALATHLLRWKFLGESQILSLEKYDVKMLAYPVLVFLSWQVCYTIFQIKYLDFYPELIFSQRRLASKEGFNKKLILKFGILLGVLDSKEKDMDPLAGSTTIVFTSLQITLACLSIALSYPQYLSYNWNISILSVTFLCSIWRGITYHVHTWNVRS